jgi:endonuclease/exonuclease/phosphatase family metal-dependent hydrolase
MAPKRAERDTMPTGPVRLLNFNIEYGAEAYSPKDAAAIIERSGADVAVISEAWSRDGKRDAGAAIATALGWRHVPLRVNLTAVVARWPITVVNGRLGLVAISPPDAPTFYVASVHLTDYPYQPFQASGIPYCLGGVCQPTVVGARALVDAADAARSRDVARLLEAIKGGCPRSAAVFIVGDFNEPSHLDWTPRAAAAGLCPVAAPFPASRRLARAGFVDAFRARYPDEVAHPGLTWPARDPGYPHRADRIDFVYVRARGGAGAILDAEVLDTPSDHRALLASVDLSKAQTHTRARGGDAAPEEMRARLIAGIVAAVVIVIVVIIAAWFGRWVAQRARAHAHARALGGPVMAPPHEAVFALKPAAPLRIGGAGRPAYHRAPLPFATVAGRAALRW